jgi:TolA-binding protein
MNCRLVDERNLLEQYVLGRLADHDRDALELHVFECDRCLYELETLHTLQRELSSQRAVILSESSAPRRHWYWQIAAAAAMLVLAAGLGIWRRAAPAVPSVTAIQPPAATTARGADNPTAPPPPRGADLVALARIEPPPYLPLNVRGNSRSPSFDRAMRQYADGDYAGAARGLQRALADAPDDLPTNFFLGVSLLMIDDASAAAARLRRTVRFGDSPFQQLADLYLAKALIRQGDIDGARRELRNTTKLAGSHAAEARELLQQLESAGSRPR